MEELADSFAEAISGFSVMDNHLHVLVRLDPEVAQGWSDEEVVRRWGRLFPPRDKSRPPLPVSSAWVEWRLQDAQWVATARGSGDTIPISDLTSAWRSNSETSKLVGFGPGFVFGGCQASKCAACAGSGNERGSCRVALRYQPSTQLQYHGNAVTNLLPPRAVRTLRLAESK
jgi:hypothetical protein